VTVARHHRRNPEVRVLTRNGLGNRRLLKERRNKMEGLFGPWQL
jgi:hypothetical protein